VSAASVVVVLGLTVAVLPTAHAIEAKSSSSSSQSMAQFLQEADTPVNEPNGIRSIQVAAWFTFGGGQIAVQLSAGLKEFSAHLSAGAAAAQNGQLSAQWVATYESDCRGLNQFALKADAYFPVPDPRIQQPWAQAVAELAKGARTCVTSLEQANGSAFLSAIDVLLDGGKRMAAAYSSMSAEIRKYGLSGTG
jgi:hypothetical protein